MSKLFSGLKIKDISFKSRIVISPMCQYSSIDGFANNWHLVHLGSRATGGAALIIQEATAVSPEGRISPQDMGLWKDDHIPFLKQITAFIHSQQVVAGVQLAHAGRKASCSLPWEGGQKLRPEQGGWITYAPSSIAFYPKDDAPEALAVKEILQVVEDFRNAARRALQAGYSLIEIHCAHGYLLHEFLSPLSNQRTDDYGGSFENRIRLLTDVVSAIKTVWPASLPLFVRISASDWAEGGWTLEESIKLAIILRGLGVDLIDCSSGGLVPHIKIPLTPGYQVPFAEKIRKEAGVATGAVGLITSAVQAEEILSKEQADLILIARASLRDPYFALHAAKELGDDIPWPKQYERAK